MTAPGTSVELREEILDLERQRVAAMVSKTEAACRKVLQRARERVRAERPRFAVNRELHLELLGRFVQAARSADPASSPIRVGGSPLCEAIDSPSPLTNAPAARTAAPAAPA